MTRFPERFRRPTAAFYLGAVLFAGSLSAAVAPAGLAGRVVFDDAVSGDAWSVVLIDSEGSEAARADLETDGRYRIARVEPGTYLLALGDDRGRYAPVLDAPLVLTPATVERRDVRVAPVAGDPLAQDAGDDDPLAEEEARYSRLRIWWVGLSKGKKAATILGIVGGAGLGWALLEDDDDPVSPSDPTR